MIRKKKISKKKYPKKIREICSFYRKLNVSENKAPIQLKNLVFYLSLAFFALTVLEKAIHNPVKFRPDNEAKVISYANPGRMDRELQQVEPIQLRESSYASDFSIPILDTSSRENPQQKETYQQQDYIYIYYLKFFGRGRNSYSRLVQTRRKAPNTLKAKILTVLRGLIKGPNAEEKEKGLLTALPGRLKVSRHFKVDKDGILYLSVNYELGNGAGPDTLKDRLDQLAYSLLSIREIKGIDLHIKHRKLTRIGPHRIVIPEILSRSPRKILFAGNL